MRKSDPRNVTDEDSTVVVIWRAHTHIGQIQPVVATP
jgi:hypothetical protein